MTSITSPLISDSPSMPSPKTISGLLLSDSSRKKILLILLTLVISVASKYASVITPRVTSTFIAEVSAFKLPSINLCLSDSVLTKVSVMNIPSNAVTPVNVAVPSSVLTDTIKSLGMENTKFSPPSPTNDTNTPLLICTASGYPLPLAPVPYIVCTTTVNPARALLALLGVYPISLANFTTFSLKTAVSRKFSLIARLALTDE